MTNALKHIRKIESRTARLSGLMQAAITLLRYEEECGCEPDFTALQALFAVIDEEVEELSALSSQTVGEFEELITQGGQT